MIDKLVIKFIKLERALVAQQLEIKASNNLDNKYEDNHVIFHQNGIDFADEAVWISKSNSPRVAVRMFDSNDERDVYLTKVLGWISDELFSIPNISGSLKIGGMCEVSDDGLSWTQRRLITILPNKYDGRYITESIIQKNKHSSFLFARPIDQAGDLSVNGDTCTWKRR